MPEKLPHLEPQHTYVASILKSLSQSSKLNDECLSRLGGRSSNLKDLVGKLMALGQAIGGSSMSDEVIKGEMAGYDFENVETATYALLISAADASCDASQSSLRANPVSP